MITFKTEELHRQFLDDHLRRDVRLMALALSCFMAGRDGIGIVVTAVFPEPGVPRVSASHAEGRAVDIRIKDWPDGAAQSAADWLNENFKTGIDAMPIAVYHDSGNGWHIHIQVAHRPVIIKSGVSTIII